MIALVDHSSSAAQTEIVGQGERSSAPPPATGVAVSKDRSRVEEYGFLNAPLLILAETLDDIEGLRIATTHRIGALKRSGQGTTAEITQQLEIADQLGAVERLVIRQLEKAMKGHPLGLWVKTTKGVGLKQGARLLAAIGNPYWNAAAARPRRGPAELWAYCGYHVLPAAGQWKLDSHHAPAGGGQSLHLTDHEKCVIQTPVVGGVAPRRRKGQHANWNDAARMRAHLVAEACLKAKATSPYGRVYDDGRARYAEAVHCAPCPQCGPAGKPAQPGSPLSAGHQHARALRLIAKAVLRDLFLEAKRWHEEVS